MKKNVGGIDRILRLVIGILLSVLTAFGFIGPWGWLGLLSLLFLLFAGLRRASQMNDLFFLVFVLGVSFHFIFESMLELQQGLVFIGFWMFFLIHRRHNSAIPKS